MKAICLQATRGGFIREKKSRIMNRVAFLSILLSWAAALPLSSRATETPPIVDEIPSGDTIEDETFNIAADEVRVFTLPATLQVATVLRNLMLNST
jgi:hypothetical protein